MLRPGGSGRAGAPAELRGLPQRTATTVMRPWDWALPPRSFDLEIISAHPAGWDSADRSERRPPLLFVPGASGAAWMFAEHWLGAAVRRGYPAYALSLRGHGGSAGREAMPRTVLRDYVADVLQAITQLAQPPVLVGHGMGSLVVQQVLQRYPAAAALLVAPTPMLGIAATVWHQVRADPPATVTGLLTRRPAIRPDLMFCGLDPTTGSSYLRRLDRESPLVLMQLGMKHSIGPIYSPIAVVGCREDVLVRPSDVWHAAEMYGVRPIWLPGAGHLVMLDSSHSVGLDIMLDWVDEQIGAAAPAPGGRRLSQR